MESYRNEEELKWDLNDECDFSKLPGGNGIPGRGTTVKGKGKVKRHEHG